MRGNPAAKVAIVVVGIVLAGGMSDCLAQAGPKPPAKSPPVDHAAMVMVPAGKFVFGKDRAKKTVDLPAFLIDKFEVTNRQYARFNLDHRFDPELGDLPVTMVSQADARNHCEALDKRLPTEEEWEKAARGGDGRAYPWGNEFDAMAAVTSETDFRGNPAQPLDVGSRPRGKSPSGALDMAGNVWEWTDSHDGRYAVLKGGSYFEDRLSAQATARLLSIPEDSKDYVGFRCVKDAKKR